MLLRKRGLAPPPADRRVVRVHLPGRGWMEAWEDQFLQRARPVPNPPEGEEEVEGFEEVRFFSAYFALERSSCIESWVHAIRYTTNPY